MGIAQKNECFFWGSFPKPVALNVIKTSKDAVNVQTAVPLLPNILYHSLLIEVPPIMRFMSGMGLGLVLATTSVYIVEIATTDMRGFLGCFLQFQGSIGVLLTFIIGQSTPVNTSQYHCSNWCSTQGVT